jgi:hypothetical protein
MIGLDGAAAILVLLALALFGATLRPGGWSAASARGRRARATATALLGGIAIAIAWTAVSARRAIDLHPSIGGTSELVGEWRDGAETVTFGGDGTYRCRGVRCLGVGPSGTWRRTGDNSIAVRWTDGHRVEWSVVGYHGKYRLALLPSDGNIEQWDGRLFFERAAPAR